MKDSEVVLVSGVRSAIGKFGGALKESSAVELGAQVIAAAVKQSGVPADAFDEAIVGNARQAGNGPNPGRLMAIGGGLPSSVHTHTVQQACVSSLKALILAAQAVQLGDSELVLVAGVEHMSTVPYLAPGVRWGQRSGDAQLLDGLSKDGFLDPLTGQLMGALAESWSARFEISREEQDQFALSSQQRAARAAEGGFAARTIAPVSVASRGGTVVLDTDEHPRPGTTLENLAKLKPAFRENGTVTAGNSSGITDGAVALVVASARTAERLGLTPLARIRSWAVRAVSPEDYGLSVAPASQAALEKAQIGFDHLDVIEVNEAFAIQVLAACQVMGIDANRVNPNGGAIALGHPVGQSGARIALYAALQMKEIGGRYALATLCGNGGNGGAVVFERV